MKTKNLIMAFILLWVVLFLSSTALATFITPTWTGPFTADQKKCIENAIANWEAVLDSVNILSIDFVCDNSLTGNGVTYLDQFYSEYQKQPKAATIKLNNDKLWWDPTPDIYTVDEIPSDKRDGISTTMHEICHALGFTKTLNPDGGFTAHVKDLIDDSPDLGLVWTDGTLTVDLDDAHMTHTVQAGLMYYAGALGVRNVIGDYHTNMLITSHECYTPEPATLSLLALGGLGALLRRRKSKA